MHPALARTWLQTGGIPVEPIHKDLRDEFDRVSAVADIGGACFRLLDSNGRQVGLVQFQGTAQERLIQTVGETVARLAEGREKPADILAGDTVIRALDLSDPVDRAMAEAAISRPEANVIAPDLTRQDPPPIDLPDYAPTSVPEDVAYLRKAEEARVQGGMIGLGIAVVIAGVLVVLHLLGKL